MGSSSPGGGGFWRRSARRVLASLAFVACIAVPITAGDGAAHAADQTLTAGTATGAQLVLGQPILITVSAKSDTLVSGTVVISAETAPPVSYDLEVPAGTTKELTVVGMPLQYPQAGYSIDWFSDDGKRLAGTNLRSSLRVGDTVVGVFPSLGTDFPDRLKQPTDTDAFLFTIPDSQIELPSTAFAQYDVIVATMDDIDRLDDDLMLAFKAWLAGGGRLAIEDGDAAGVAALLEVDEANGRYGNGTIMFTNGSVRSDGWERVSRPVAARSLTSLGPIGWSNGSAIGVESIPQGLVTYSGEPLIGVLPLLGLVVLYALVVGPLMFLAFRRRRRALWLVGPLIALVACCLIWLDSTRRHNSIRDAHGTVIEVQPVASEAVSIEMLYSKSGGAAGLTLPPAFIAQSDGDDWSLKKVAVDQGGTTISQTVEPGSFTVYSGFGPVTEFDGQLTGTAAVEEGTASGTITNRLAVDLHQVAVMWNGKAKNIGDVPAGETVDYTIDKTDSVGEFPAVSVWGDAYKDVGWWGSEPKPSGKPRPDIVSPAVWDVASYQIPTIGYAADVDVVGWTDELASPVTGTANGVNAIVTRLKDEPPPEDGSSAFVYGTEPVNSQSWAADALVRLDAPEDFDTLSIKLPKGWDEPELLIDGTWLKLSPKTGDTILIPSSALDDDQGLYLKATLDMEQLSQSETPEPPVVQPPVLRPPSAGDKTVALASVSGESADATKEGKSS